MNWQSFIIAICFVSAYGISVNKVVKGGDDSSPTTTFAPESGNEVLADDIVSDDSQVGVSTVQPVQSDSVVEYTTEVSQNEVEPQPEFQYPVTPDPSAPFEYSTVNSIPDDFNFADLNLTRSINGTVQGRAACSCGRVSGKIIGGVTSKINELPWTAALVRGNIWNPGRPYCGATLINSRYVLTASHCVDGMQPRGLIVRLNQEDVYNSPNAESYEVSKIIMHPNYNRQNIDHDIALVQLSQPVNLGANVVTPACLPASNDFNIEGATATVAGWGATAQGGSTSSLLRKVNVPVLSNEKCNKETNYRGRITDNMLCAGVLEGGKDSCQGDSGGPLVIKNGDRHTLIGVVSWGYGCAQRNSPGVYARVSRYPDWILANTRGADWCSG